MKSIVFAKSKGEGQVLRLSCVKRGYFSKFLPATLHHFPLWGPVLFYELYSSTGHYLLSLDICPLFFLTSLLEYNCFTMVC